MNKCDKCGCEHNSTDKCPRCGAAVIVVNSDYLKRKQMWEESHKDGKEDKRSADERLKELLKANIRKPEQEQKIQPEETELPFDDFLEEEYAVFDSISSAQIDNEKDKKRNSKNIFSKLGRIDNNKAIVSRVDAVFSKVRRNKKSTKENAYADYSQDIIYIDDAENTKDNKRKNKKTSNRISEKNKNTNESNDKNNSRAVKNNATSRNGKKSAGNTLKKYKKAVVVGLSALCLAGIFLMFKFFNKDSSDIIYFDGHEIISINNGVIFDLDNLVVNDNAISAQLISYSEQMNALLLEEKLQLNEMEDSDVSSKTDELYASYNGDIFKLDKMPGVLTDQIIFSQNGRFLAYVTCVETETDNVNDADGKYYLAIEDLKEQKRAYYESNNMLQFSCITDDGKVIYISLNTMEHSLVISKQLYGADLNGCYLIENDVDEVAIFDTNGEKSNRASNRSIECIAYLKADKLYRCDAKKNITSEKSYEFVDDEVSCIMKNMLDTRLMYLKDSSLYTYDKEAKLIARNIDKSCQIFFYNDNFLIYRKNNELYSCVNGKVEILAENVIGEMTYFSTSNGGSLIFNEAGKCISRVKISQEKIAGKDIVVDGIGDYGMIINQEGVVCGINYVKSGALEGIVFEKEKQYQFTINNNDIPNTKPNKIYMSGKYLYFTDDSQVLWKVTKDCKYMESLNFVKYVNVVNWK